MGTAARLRLVPAVRDEAAATLVGLDAEVVKELKAKLGRFINRAAAG